MGSNEERIEKVLKIGVNYLLEVQELFEEGKIDFIDYFKLYSLNENLSPMNWCVQRRNVMFHGVVGQSSVFGDVNLVKNTDVKKTKEILEISKTPYLSGHICTLNEKQTEKETLEAIQENIKNYRNIFKKDVVLENIPYRDYYRHCLFLLNPELISKIVYDNNCKFLFDISHARKAAQYFKISLEEYVSKLPMDCVIEFHLAGMTSMPNGDEMDFHGKMREEDYQFLEKALKKYPTLQYITLEYGSYVPDKKAYLIKGADIPLASFEKRNSKVKDEVYEQLIRIKKMIDEDIG